MAKITKTELNRVLSNLPSEKVVSVVCGDEEFTFTVKTSIPAEEYAAFVDAVTDSIQSNGKFYYGLLDLAFRLQVISVFTNIPIPEKSANRSKLAYSSIYDQVSDKIGGQLFTLYNACKRKLENDEHTSRILFESAVNPDPMSKLVNVIEDTIEAVKDGVLSQGMLPAFSKLIESNLGIQKEGDMVEQKNQV